MNIGCEKGVQYALRSFNTVNYGSYLHLNYRYLRLYSTRLLLHYQPAQLRHHTVCIRQVRNHEKRKSSREEKSPELPLEMRECEALLAELNDEFDRLKEIVCGYPGISNKSKNRNRSEGAYQHQKDEFERKVAIIITSGTATTHMLLAVEFVVRSQRQRPRYATNFVLSYLSMDYITVSGPVCITKP